MSAINLTIDGQQVEVEQGSTILDAAQKVGVEIPTFCHDPELARLGACRICVVEVEKARALVAACSAPAGPDMVVHTDTDRVRKARNIILRLILANHSLECITCEKNGDCKLQDYCYQYGVESSDFVGAVKEVPLDDTNPFIVRDMNKCILCGRCVGRCQNIVGAGAIDFINRGFTSNVGTAFGDPLEDSSCVFCGVCVDVCPVGALSAKARLGKGRAWEVEQVETVCPYCATGCKVDLHVNEDDEIVDASADEEVGINQGKLCARGRFGWDFTRHEHRITKPMVKEDGVYVEIEWEEALEMVAERIQEVESNFGAEAIGGLASSRVTNEEIYLFQKLLRSLGSNNIDHLGRYRYSTSPQTSSVLFKSGVMTGDLQKINEADAVLLVNADISQSHPVLNYQLRSAASNGTRVFSVGVEEPDVSVPAERCLVSEVGKDQAVLNGIINVILEENLINGDAANDKATLEEIKKAVDGFTPKYVEDVTGVPATDIKEVARGYANAEQPMILFNTDTFRIGAGLKSVKAMLGLAAVAGMKGVPAGGVSFLQDYNNSLGATILGAVPNYLPNFQDVSEQSARDKFGKAWETEINAQPGLSLKQMIEEAKDGNIQCMYIMGEDPISGSEDPEGVKDALENLDFLVVQDIFLSETARYADIVLPSAAFAEKLGTYINQEGRVQLGTPALDLPGDAMTDFEIVAHLAFYLGLDWPVLFVGDVFGEIASLAPAFEGMSYVSLDKIKQDPSADSWQAILNDLDELAGQDEPQMETVEAADLTYLHAKGSMTSCLAEMKKQQV